MASAAWWANSWGYRFNTSINNVAKDLNHYEVTVIKNWTTEYVAGKVNRTCKDVRVTYHNTTSGVQTEIPYWIKDCELSTNDNMTMWVNVTYLKNNTDTTIYVYYGHEGIESTSAIGSTFIVGVDFEVNGGYSTGGIGGQDGWVDASGSEDNISTAHAKGNQSFLRKFVSGNAYSDTYRAVPLQTSSVIFEYDTYPVTHHTGLGFGGAYGIWGAKSGVFFADTNKMYYPTDAGYKTQHVATGLNQWYHVKIIIDPTAAVQNAKLYINDNSTASYDGDLWGSYTTYQYISIIGYSSAFEMYFDNIRLRQYAYPEPVATIGEEEIEITTTTSTTTTIPGVPVLSSVSALDVYYINNHMTASVQLTNTLGSYLEGRDCAVAVYQANTSYVVYDYDTLCCLNGSFIDANGNRVSVSDCKLTDSLGFYHFKGRTDESLGYVYGESYDLVFTCSGKNSTHTFLMDLEKPYDMQKVEYFSQRYGGLIVLAILVGAGILIVVSFVVWFIYQSKKIV